MNRPVGEIRRVSVDRGDEHLLFERRDPNRWQMVEPVDVAAEPSRVEALVRNLQDLRKSADAGTITGSADSFGLAPPTAIVRLFDTTKDSSGTDEPIATLDVGKVVGRQRYVHPAGGKGIEVVDARLLDALNLSGFEWRDPVLMPVPTFQVESFKITRRGQSGAEPQVIRAERSGDGRWKLVSPIERPRTGPRSRACCRRSHRSA